MKLRVLITDDHAGMLEWLVAKVGEEFEVVAALQDGSLALEEVKRLDPDVIVLDFAMLPMNGLEVMRRVRDSGARAEFVLVTGYTDPELADVARSAGARGFVSKDRLMEDLIPSIRSAAKKD
jgi:DNA-binding NarL/FixJ family response regulator